MLVKEDQGLAVSDQMESDLVLHETGPEPSSSISVVPRSWSHDALPFATPHAPTPTPAHTDSSTCSLNSRST